MTSAHDITEIGDCSVTCRCGRVFVGASLTAAFTDHEHHYGIEMARAALEQADT